MHAGNHEAGEVQVRCRQRAGERERTAALAPASKFESVLLHLREQWLCDTRSRATYHNGRLDLYRTEAAGAAAAVAAAAPRLAVAVGP